MKRTTMTPRIPGGRDRAGHGLIAVLFAVGCWLMPAAAAAQSPGPYKAQRFDVVITPRNGDLDVLETITFEFQSGTFRRVWRDLPTSRTDGIEVGEARMDGAVFPPGNGPGHVEVTGRGKVRVQWNFPPAGPSVHTFQLRYVARGVAYREGGTDVVRWRALPSEHRYTIDQSRIMVQAEGTIRPSEFRRIQSINAAAGIEGTAIDARGIGANGWLIVDLRAPAGRFLSAPPQWQQRHEAAAALAPRWIGAAGVVLAVGVLFLLGTRQGYPSPSVTSDETTTTAPPALLPAALASVLAAKGGASGYRPIGTLLDLADRGVLVVREKSRVLGVRQYDVEQVPARHQLLEHEEEALRIAFADRPDPTSLAKARSRLARGARRFAAAVNADLEARGLIDPTRKAVRDRLTAVSMAMVLLGAASCIVAATFIPRFDAWPFLLPAAIMVAGIVGFVIAGSMTPLSDAGLIEAARWRGFRRYLKMIADGKTARALDVEPRWIVYGIAIGLATQWARYLKAHPGVAPAWFVPATRDDGSAFAAFISSNGAAASGGHGGAAGGAAAGGGASGAG